MNQKSHILVCTLGDFFIGFDISQVDQIVQKKQVQIHAQRSIVDFQGYAFPFFDLSGLFHCSESQSNFVLLLNSSSGHFFIPIKSIEAIVDVENDAGIRTAENMKHLVVFDYARRIILWNDLPIPVIETESISEKIFAENTNGE
jgi:chemotaxis signal transduction protein